MAKRMMSIGHDGSLYDDISGDFHKPPRTDSMFLEFDKVKREKQNQLLLPTPDSRAFPLSTPDVATLLSSCGPSVTTNTPTPSRFLRPGAPVTAEQEMYAQGFLDALDQLQQTDPREKNGKPAPRSNSNSPPPPSVIHHTHSHSTTTHGLPTTHVGHHHSPHISSEFGIPDHSLASVAPTYVTATMDYIPNIPPPSPQTAYPENSTQVHAHTDFANSSYPVMNEYSHGAPSYNFTGQSGSSSSLPPFGQISNPMNPQLLRELQAMVPADMKTMETMKVERKKARNRIAASKCRIRRLQRESDLQGKVRMLKDHNQDLNDELNELKEQILSLKRALLQHVQTGCQVNLPEGFRSKLDSISSE